MDIEDLLPQTLLRKAGEYTRLLWVRVVLMGLLAFVALGLTQIFERFVPDHLARMLDDSSADRLLDIIANAMLAVTIFSITIMVSVYQSSASQFTPRVHRLIVQDKTTQNTMAAFIGAYVYALVGIILREMGVYSDDRAFVLFGVTALVMSVIVVYLIRWVLHLQRFGSLIETARQIEEATSKQFKERLRNPCLGGNALVGDVPEDAEVLVARQSGYIQHVYPEALQSIAERHGVDVYLLRSIGAFVFLNEPLIRIAKTGTPDKGAGDRASLEEKLLKNVRIGDLRTFDQDPRFGLIVMGEVASKALSPGVNDPGTAITVISRIGRILSLYKDEVTQERDDVLANLWVRPLDPVDLLNDGFAALARDGATTVEVQQRLQVVLTGLMRHPDEGLAKAAREAAEVHLQRAVGCIDYTPDCDRILSSARKDVRETVQSNPPSGA